MIQNVSQLLIPSGTKRRSGQKNLGVLFAVLHDTGNPGSTALGNAKYYTDSCNEIEASAHVFIDDKDIIEVIPLDEKAWHVMYGTPTDNIMFGDDANDVAVGIEACYGGTINSSLVWRNVTLYLRELMHEYHLRNYHFVGHFMLDPGRKTDPQNFLKFCGKTWMDLMVELA